MIDTLSPGDVWSWAAALLAVILLALGVYRLTAIDRKLRQATTNLESLSRELAGLLGQLSGSLRLARIRIESIRQLAPSPPGLTPPSCVLVVRRDESEVFRFLAERLGTRGTLEVIWDRRIAERRTRMVEVTLDRRTGERRGRPAMAWPDLGLTLAFGGGRRGPGARPEPRVGLQGLRDVSRQLSEVIRMMQQAVERAPRGENLLGPPPPGVRRS